MTTRYSFAVDADELINIQSHAQREGDLLIWTIYDHPSDVPDAFVARPHSTRHRGPMTCHFQHESLLVVRKQMHRLGLLRMQRSENDDPIIVETWV